MSAVINSVKSFLVASVKPLEMFKAGEGGTRARLIRFALVSLLLGMAFSNGIRAKDDVSTLRWLFPEMSNERYYYWATEVRSGLVYRDTVVYPTPQGHEAVAFAPGERTVDLRGFSKYVEIHDGYAVVGLYGMKFKGEIDINLWEKLTNGRSTMTTLADIIWRADVKMFDFFAIIVYPLAFLLNAIFFLLAAAIGRTARILADGSRLVGRNLSLRHWFDTVCAAALLPSVIVVFLSLFLDSAFIYAFYNFITLIWIGVCAAAPWRGTDGDRETEPAVTTE